MHATREGDELRKVEKLCVMFTRDDEAEQESDTDRAATDDAATPRNIIPAPRATALAPSSSKHFVDARVERKSWSQISSLIFWGTCRAKIHVDPVRQRGVGADAVRAAVSPAITCPNPAELKLDGKIRKNVLWRAVHGWSRSVTPRHECYFLDV